ncbi:hypothetical protein [Endomicrobium proavitum]|uniref:TadE-like protein n=1 Tax=Endomicrobium proavitum TaxID=1408281 RepID=A0A0G3WJI8_9BACT|nr:hypothetical protein [Endomicrobium proavitum]AKL97664.1 hypothetical protein Epro_0285 [Endomicrobium proavitum]
MKNNSGQSMIEALFTVVFTTVIMFCFLQLCIMIVDDMTANEAAFVAMRSAAVTKGTAGVANNEKAKEAKERVENYMMFFYPLSKAGKSGGNPSKFVYSDINTVKPYFQSSDRDEDAGDGDEDADDGEDETGESVKIYVNKDSGHNAKDYSGHRIRSHTTKIYYFTRIMFGSIVAKTVSVKDRFFSGSKRYASARSRMVPSPDAAYYNKAYPGAQNFE